MCVYFTGESCSDVVKVTRSEWGARSTTLTSLKTKPVKFLFIHHTAGASCTTKADCIKSVKGVQDDHIDDNGWSDIGYNYLVSN